MQIRVAGHPSATVPNLADTGHMTDVADHAIVEGSPRFGLLRVVDRVDVREPLTPGALYAVESTYHFRLRDRMLLPEGRTTATPESWDDVCSTHVLVTVRRWRRALAWLGWFTQIAASIAVMAGLYAGGSYAVAAKIAVAVAIAGVLGWVLKFMMFDRW